MAEKEMSPMAFQTRLIEYFEENGEFDVEERVESLRQAISKLNNPYIFSEIKNTIELEDIKLGELVSSNGSINNLKLEQVIKTAEGRHEHTRILEDKTLKESDPFLENMIQNEELKKEELLNRIEQIDFNDMTIEDYKFIRDNAEFVAENMSDSQRQVFYEKTLIGQDEVKTLLTEVGNISSRDGEVVKHGDRVEEGYVIVSKSDYYTGEPVYIKVKVTEEEAKYYEALKGNSRYTEAFFDETGVLSRSKVKQFETSLLKVRAEVAIQADIITQNNPNVSEEDIIKQIDLLSNSNIEKKDIETLMGIVDFNKMVEASVEDRLEVTEYKDESNDVIINGNNAVPMEIFGENGVANLEDFFSQAFTFAPDYYDPQKAHETEPKVATTESSGREEFASNTALEYESGDQYTEVIQFGEGKQIGIQESAELDFLAGQAHQDQVESEQASQEEKDETFEKMEEDAKGGYDPKANEVEAKENPLKKFFSRIYNAVTRKNKPALDAPQMQAEASLKQKAFDAETDGHDFSDMGVVPTSKIIQSQILKFAKGLKKLVSRDNQEKNESTVVNQPNQLVGTIDSFVVSDDVKQNVVAVGKQAKQIQEQKRYIPQNVKNAGTRDSEEGPSFDD